VASTWQARIAGKERQAALNALALAESRRKEADAQRREAGQSRALAEVQKTIAEQQMAIAEQQKEVAERRFNDVRTMASGILFNLSDQLRVEGVSTTLRSRVITQSLAYLDKLSEEKNPEPGLSLEIARGYIRMAELQGRPQAANLGDREGARKSF
jgi:serine/threonine-protein kinase